MFCCPSFCGRLDLDGYISVLLLAAFPVALGNFQQAVGLDVLRVFGKGLGIRPGEVHSELVPGAAVPVGY